MRFGNLREFSVVTNEQADDVMGEWGAILLPTALIAGVVLGYVLGFRHGELAGELKAIKSRRGSHGIGSRRSRRAMEHETSA